MKYPQNTIARLAAIAAFALVPVFAQAGVDTIALWKFDVPAGMPDGASLSGDAVKGAAGSPELLIMGNPSYSTDTPNPTISRGSIKFQRGDALHLEQPITDLVDLFGMEMWVRTDEAGLGKGVIMLSNGRSQPGFGYGLLQTADNEYRGIFDGVNYLFNPDDAIKVTGEWTHLAVVRDATDFGTQVYANGELIYSSERVHPVPMSPAKDGGVFVVGGSLVGNGAIFAAFEGNIALVRVFKFRHGQFNPRDLLTGKK